jgi:ABC-type amino acid transport substrate-binding protein
MVRVAAITVALALLLGAHTPAQAAALDQARTTGKLRLGYRADARPFSYKDESGQAAGYSVALCQRIVDAAKAELGLPDVQVEYVEIGITDRFDALQQGRIDLLCGAATATLERRRQVSFSIPIFPGGIGALLRADFPERLKAVMDGREPPYEPRWRGSPALVLEKRTVSAVAGTTAEPWLEQRRQELNVDAEIVPVPSYQEGIDRVLARRSDVLFGDRAILLDAATRSPSAADLDVLTRYFTYEPIALALARGDEDLRWLVDRTLSGLYRSGEIAAIYTDFFGEPHASALLFFRLVALPE